MGADLVWLRNDLRLGDNPALAAAFAKGGPVHALYVEESDATLRPRGAASRWWLGQSLAAFGRELAARGVVLHVARGPAGATIAAHRLALRADTVLWNRRYAPSERALDATVKAALRADGVAVRSFPGNVLVEPFDIATRSGPYAVFTPFWHALRASDIPSPLPAPDGRAAVPAPPLSDTAPGWAAKFHRHWQVGEAAARRTLLHFLDHLLPSYPNGRDRPAEAVTSRLSPHLAFGEISARQVWHAALAAAHDHPAEAPAVEKFLSELAWREFNTHQLYHRADIASEPMRPRFAGIEWRDDPAALAAWRRGRTGIPIVDAGMRELWETGFMHNRVRMLAASLLSKNLLIDWRLGERWFWDTLVDADPANNPGNWQWVAGSGLDAAPYFRIFNPVTQGERFDPDGTYVRRWVPELERLPAAWIHRPWEAPDAVRRAAGIASPADYPTPIVDLKSSRMRALTAFQAL